MSCMYPDHWCYDCPNKGLCEEQEQKEKIKEDYGGN